LMVYPHMIPGKGAPTETNTRRTLNAVEEPSPVGAAGIREGRNSAVGVGNVSTASAAMKAERYNPKIFGFKINEIAKLQRWQGAMRDR
jgi:casein kinase II subunit beta